MKQTKGKLDIAGESLDDVHESALEEDLKGLDIKRLRKRIKDLALPALAEQLMSTLFGMVDMVMVGHVSTASLAAVGLSNQPTMLTLAVFQALNIGSTALVARFMGTDDRKSATRVVEQTLIVTFALGLIAMLLGYTNAERLMIFMGAEPEVLPLATQYFSIISMGFIFVNISLGVGAVLRGAGDTITPMRYNIIANSINMVLNYILIFGKMGFPALGVKGAAIATITAQGVGMTLALLSIHHPDAVLNLSEHRGISIDIDLLRRILNIGIPAMIEQLLFRTGQMEFARTVAGLGTTVYAAHQVAVNVFGLSFAPSVAFSIAATTLVGQTLGAGRPDLAEKYGLETRKIGMMVAVAIASSFFFFGRQIAGIYSDDLQVIAMAAGCLKFIAIIQPMQSTQFILAGALRGAGDTKGPLISSFVAIWGIRVVLAKVFIRLGLGLNGAWLASLCDQIFRSTFMYLRYNAGKWKEIKV